MKTNNKGYTLLELLMVIILIVIIPAIIWGSSLWTDRNLDFWFTYFKGVPTDIPMWLSVLTTIILNGAALVGNILAELFKFIV